MSKPTQVEIKARLAELRAVVETHEDPVVQRVAYAIEHGIRWATESTTDWPSGTDEAEATAELIRRDLENTHD